MTDRQIAGTVRRPPRALAWVLLLASAAAVLLTGLAATVLLLYRLSVRPTPIGPAFWIWLLAAGGLTVLSLGLRALRWIFLLRRSETRIPIRDAYIGYLAGLSLLFAPFLLGEIAVRAFVHRARGRVPVGTTAVVNLWERWLDMVALAGLAGAMAMLSGQTSAWSICLLAAAASTMFGPVRRTGLEAAVMIVRPLARLAGDVELGDFRRLATRRSWLVGLATSLAAWILPGVAFWGLSGVWGPPVGLARAEMAYASSAFGGGLVLAPGGVLVAGGQLLAALGEAGFSEAAAALTVVGIRIATAGLSTVVGGVFLLMHLRSRVDNASHFDTLADTYDVQIPEARRQALLTKKTELMREIIAVHRVGNRGLDVGCGQGWYVARMRELGFEVTGIDASAGQVQLAAEHVGEPGVIAVGSALQIPAADDSYDFVYSINVLHHLASTEEQQAAFAELFRVLRPGGLLFVHEINTRNLLFRFYMGYVFPSLNCIDEGVERWLLPNRLASYTDVPVIDVRCFTFLPEFIPATLARLLAPIERRLESSPLGIYSAHYMAVLQKPA